MVTPATIVNTNYDFYTIQAALRYYLYKHSQPSPDVMYFWHHEGTRLKSGQQVIMRTKVSNGYKIVGSAIAYDEKIFSNPNVLVSCNANGYQVPLHLLCGACSSRELYACINQTAHVKQPASQPVFVTELHNVFLLPPDHAVADSNYISKYLVSRIGLDKIQDGKRIESDLQQARLFAI